MGNLDFSIHSILERSRLEDGAEYGFSAVHLPLENTNQLSVCNTYDRAG